MLLKSFIDYLRYERAASARTVREYQDDLKAFESFYKGLDSNLSWKDIDTDIAREWVVDMMNRGLKPNSVHRRLSALRSFYKYLYRRGYVKKDPVHLLTSPKREKGLPAFIQESDMDRLLDQEGMFEDSFDGRRDHLIISMFYETGLRVSELVGLNIDDINCETCTLKVTGKGNKQRVVPFGGGLLHLINIYKSERVQLPHLEKPAFYVSRKGCRLTTDQVRVMVRRQLSLVTTQQHRSPHVLRHTFATSMLNHNADLQSVKELLGHASLSTTEIYTHTTFEELRKVYQEAHPRA